MCSVEGLLGVFLGRERETPGQQRAGTAGIVLVSGRGGHAGASAPQPLSRDDAALASTEDLLSKKGSAT